MPPVPQSFSQRSCLIKNEKDNITIVKRLVESERGNNLRSPKARALSTGGKRKAVAQPEQVPVVSEWRLWCWVIDAVQDVLATEYTLLELSSDIHIPIGVSLKTRADEILSLTMIEHQNFQKKRAGLFRGWT